MSDAAQDPAVSSAIDRLTAIAHELETDGIAVDRIRELADEALSIAQAVSSQLASAMEMRGPESDSEEPSGSDTDA